jgi:predicted HicB family RNase H-like nuclease
MATLNLQDLIDRIAHNTNNEAKLVADTLAAADISGARVTAKQATANASASYDEALELFSGKKTGTGKAISTELEQLKELKKSLEEAGGTGVYKKLAADQQRAIGKQAENVFADAAKGVRHHEEVIELAEKQAGKIKEQIGKRFAAQQKDMIAAIEAKTLSAADKAAEIRQGTDTLLANRTAVIEKVEEHFKDLRGTHEETVKNLKNLVGEIEKETELSSAKHFAKAGATSVESVAAKEAAAGGNIVSRHMKAFSKAGTGGKIASAVGAVVVLDGLRNAAQLAGVLPMGTDEQGQELPRDTGKLIKTAAELAGGVFVINQALKGHMPAKTLAI